jgi:hypothetical protein
MTTDMVPIRSTLILEARDGRHGVRGRMLATFLTALLLIAALTVAVASNDVGGVEQQSVPSPNFDLRASLHVPVEPTPTQLGALAALPEVAARWNAQSPFPAVLIRYGGTLTETDTEPLAFLVDNAELLGLTADDLEMVQPLKEYRTAHNGATHVHLQQVDHGRTVYGSLIKLTLDREGRVVIAGGTFFAGARVDQDPRLSAEDAVMAAARSVGIETSEALSITSELVTFPMP